MTLSDVPSWQRTGIFGSPEMQRGLNWLFPIYGRWSRELADRVPTRDMFDLFCSRCPLGCFSLLEDVPLWWRFGATMPIPIYFGLLRIESETSFLPACMQVVLSVRVRTEDARILGRNDWRARKIALYSRKLMCILERESDSISHLLGGLEGRLPNVTMRHPWS